MVKPLNLDEDTVVKLFETDIDTKKLFSTVLYLEPKILDYCSVTKGNYQEVTGSETTKYFNIYNFFQFTHTPEMWSALESIISAFYLMNPPSGIYVFQSWVNIYRQGGNIHWHTHRPAGYFGRFKIAYHGFMCVNVRDTYTRYRFITGRPNENIKGKEGLIAIGRSNEDEHCTDPWPYSDEPRVTIAFDFHKVENNDEVILPMKANAENNTMRYFPVVVT